MQILAINLWDAGVALLTGLYVNSRLNGKRDDALIRTIAGGAAGIFTAYKGPEIIDSMKNFSTKKEYSSAREKLGVSIAVGALTYLVSDPLLNSAKTNFKNNVNNNIKNNNP